MSTFLDAMNVDVKAFNNEFYKKICKASLEPVLQTCERAKELDIHLEVTYLVIPGYNDSNDEFPMWSSEAIYYMSDNGPNKRNNLWKYDLTSSTHTQLTHFTDFDITYPEIGTSDIIFEAGGKLYLYELASGNSTEVKIDIISDQIGLIPEQKNVSTYQNNIDLDGNIRIEVVLPNNASQLDETQLKQTLDNIFNSEEFKKKMIDITSKKDPTKSRTSPSNF